MRSAVCAAHRRWTTIFQGRAGRIQYDQFTWYISTRQFGFLTPTPAAFREGRDLLRDFNDRLESCDAVFDARADNLIRFVDRIAADIGSTSAALRDRSLANNAGWFDTRADNHYWFTYGQLYAYYGILKAAHADFADIIRTRRLEDVWNTMEEQLRATLSLQSCDRLQRQGGRLDHAVAPGDGRLLPACACAPTSSKPAAFLDRSTRSRIKRAGKRVLLTSSITA